ncbi:hypothetical protein [Aliikangiella sp. IMCC44359]|uniref:hypothetical protein n=1 Tax=Aliikangiella sp. IMCC44359 TaxID=3459125 RepID=UPI00403B180A
MFNILETQEHQLVGMISNKDSNQLPPFTKGRLINKNFYEGQLKVEFESSHGSLPDYFELDAIPIVSDKFVDFWQDLPIDNYQLFPAVIRFPDKEFAGYSILNIEK